MPVIEAARGEPRKVTRSATSFGLARLPIAAASIDALMAVAAYFKLDRNGAIQILAKVERTVSTWRVRGRELGMSSGELEQFAWIGAVPALSGVVGQMLTYVGGWRLAMRRAVQDLGVGGHVWPQENLNSL